MLQGTFPEFTFQSLSLFQYNVDLCSGLKPSFNVKILKTNLRRRGLCIFHQFLKFSLTRFHSDEKLERTAVEGHSGRDFN